MIFSQRHAPMKSPSPITQIFRGLISLPSKLSFSIVEVKKKWAMQNLQRD